MKRLLVVLVLLVVLGATRTVWASDSERVKIASNPLREFYEAHCYPSGWAYLPEASEKPEAYAPYEFLRMTVKLSDDGIDDSLLATPWFSDKQGDTYFVYVVSQDGTYRVITSDAIFAHDRKFPFYIGRMEKRNKPAVFTFGFPGGLGMNLIASWLDGNELKSEIVAEFSREECQDLDALDKKLRAKYEPGNLDVIPLAVMETLPVKGNLEDYLKKREAVTYADPVKDFQERHRKYFSEKRPAGQEMLQFVDGDRMLLSTTTLEVGDLGYYWEVYTREGETYRWSRETALQKPSENVKRIALP